MAVAPRNIELGAPRRGSITANPAHSENFVAVEKIKKLVLAYSGGLDTSVMLRWIRDEFKCDVIAYCADVGQAEETKGLKAKAIATGASKLYIEDIREEFARDFVFPMLRASAVYEGYYLLGTSIARPAIAKRQVEVARKEGADAVAHGATGKGNDQVRFELTFARLAPDLKIIAPWRRADWPFNGRAEMIAYANQKKIPISVTAEKPYSMDRNLVHISYEGGILEDPWLEPYRDMFRLTAAPEDAPNRPEYVEIEYAKGNPVAINGERLGPARIIERANEIGGRHGVGRVDLVENRYVGIKSRGVYETPGVTLLYHAHRAVEQLTLDREAMHQRDSLIPRYAEMVYYGYWFAPEREALQALMDDTQKNVTGTARLKLFKGCATIAGRKSPNSLYDPKLASFEEAGGYNQADAEGFIRLAGMRLRALAKAGVKGRSRWAK
ncbi:MAG TPA: argininosuccinate synthase [Candidatus Binataceae bacterium]|nr:argininosuccinate synthase [Candidatus Binataceae bacterium]